MSEQQVWYTKRVEIPILHAVEHDETASYEIIGTLCGRACKRRAYSVTPSYYPVQGWHQHSGDWSNVTCPQCHRQMRRREESAAYYRSLVGMESEVQ